MCALSKRVLLQGRLYVFEEHLCFHCNLFGYAKTKVGGYVVGGWVGAGGGRSRMSASSSQRPLASNVRRARMPSPSAPPHPPTRPPR